jgi:hypothetical protein
MSLARLHHRKDVVHRPFDGGPTAPVGLVWPIDRTTDLVEEMIGIVRGRTVNSSRGRGRSRSAADTGEAPAVSGAATRGRGDTQGGKGVASGRKRAPSAGRRGGSASSGRKGATSKKKNKRQNGR